MSFALLLALVGCTTQKTVFSTKTSLPYTESEMNLIVALELLKQKQKVCKGDCDLTMESHFSYFDTCAMVFLEHIPVKKTLFKKSIDVPEGVYYVEDFGTIRVFHHADNEVPDFAFTPLYYSEKENVLYGQMKYKDGRRRYFSFDIINNNIYIRYSGYYYGSNCSMDFDSY